MIEPTGKLLNFADFRKYSDTFIESGSCYGSGIDKAIEADYTDIRSVEAYAPHYDHCKVKYKGTNIKLWFGLSQDKMPEMLADINKPAVVWLDAHVSGKDSAGHDEVNGAKPEYQQHIILMKELEIILNHRTDHVIILDDQIGDDSQKYVDFILSKNANYKFYFYDELRERLHKNKVLACIP